MSIKNYFRMKYEVTCESIAFKIHVPPDEAPGTPNWNILPIGRFYCISIISSCVCVLGLFRKEHIPHICDAKAGSREADPCPGQGPASWKRYQDV